MLSRPRYQVSVYRTIGPLVSVRHAKLEQSRINLISFSLVLKTDSHCSIPIQLTINDFTWVKYCFL